MTGSKVAIAKGPGIAYMTLDDDDVSRAVSVVDVHLEPRGVPEVSLTLLPGTVSLELDDAKVTIDDKTHALLVQLGWTPPPPD